MTRARPRTRVVALTLAALAMAGAAEAQDAYTYLVRESDRGVTWPEAGGELPTLDVTGARHPVRVIQGPEFTWVVPEGDSLTVRQAIMVLHGNVPVRPEAGGLMVEGWPGPRSSPYDSVTLRLERGHHDRDIAGRPAEHYVLRASALRTGPADAGTPDRLDFTAHFWVLPGIPHSWAPFGYGSEGLPGMVPRLRDALDGRLAELGLVGRAIIRLEYRSGGSGADARKLTGFEISGLETVDPPPAVHAVVPRTLLTALQDQVLSDPGAVCLAVARDSIANPGGRNLDTRARKSILAQLNDRCASPEVYRGLVEPRLRADPDAFCAAVAGAGDPEALAGSVFTDEQATAFDTFLSETDRARLLAELQQYCDERQVR